MLDPKTLLPELQKLVPQYSPQEIMEGIKEFAQAHPDFNNQQALQAVTMAVQSQKSAQPVAPQGKPFEGLMSQLGAKQ